jgi:ABC-type glucose/galactose transport system permease subunit
MTRKVIPVSETVNEAAGEIVAGAGLGAGAYFAGRAALRAFREGSYITALPFAVVAIAAAVVGGLVEAGGIATVIDDMNANKQVR